MIGRLFCALDRHAPEPGGVWNGGYCFTRCRRCGRDMVRSAFGEWHVPRSHRIVWAPPGDGPGQREGHRIAGAPDRTPPVAEAEPVTEGFEIVEEPIAAEPAETDFDPVPPPPPPPPPPRPSAKIKPRTATLAPRPVPTAPSPEARPAPNRRGSPSGVVESGRSPFDFDDFDESPADPPGRSSSSRHAAR